MFQEPGGSSVLPPVAPGLTGWRQPHCLDLLVTGYSSEFEGQSRKTAQHNQAGGGGLKTNGCFWWSLEF